VTDTNPTVPPTVTTTIVSQVFAPPQIVSQGVMPQVVMAPMIHQVVAPPMIHQLVTPPIHPVITPVNVTLIPLQFVTPIVVGPR
jgi:hypothetical protein